MSNRQRIRRICSKCNQELSHSAYVRHQNPTVCPEKVSIPHSSSSSTAEVSIAYEEYQPAEEDTDVASSSESELESTLSDEGVEVFSEDDCSEEEVQQLQETATEMNFQRERMKVVVRHICSFISFFFNYAIEFLKMVLLFC